MTKIELLNELTQRITEANEKKIASTYTLIYDKSIDLLMSTSKLVKEDKVSEVHSKGVSLGQFAIKIMEDVDFEYSSKLCNTSEHLENYSK